MRERRRAANRLLRASDRTFPITAFSAISAVTTIELLPTRALHLWWSKLRIINRSVEFHLAIGTRHDRVGLCSAERERNLHAVDLAIIGVVHLFRSRTKRGLD